MEYGDVDVNSLIIQINMDVLQCMSTQLDMHHNKQCKCEFWVSNLKLGPL
jgi:hypothetical protein